MSLKDAVAFRLRRKDLLGTRVTERARELCLSMESLISDGKYPVDNNSGLSPEEADLALKRFIVGLVTVELGFKNQDAGFFRKILEEGSLKIALVKSVRNSSEEAAPLSFGVHEGFGGVAFVLVVGANSFKTIADCERIMFEDRFSKFLAEARQNAELIISFAPHSVRQSTDFSVLGLLRDPANKTHGYITY